MILFQKITPLGLTFWSPNLEGKSKNVPYADASGHFSLLHPRVFCLFRLGDDIRLRKWKSQGDQVPVVLKHYIPVQVSLSGVQFSPFFLGEVHSHVLEGQALKHLGLCCLEKSSHILLLKIPLLEKGRLP